MDVLQIFVVGGCFSRTVIEGLLTKLLGYVTDFRPISANAFASKPVSQVVMISSACLIPSHCFLKYRSSGMYFSAAFKCKLNQELWDVTISSTISSDIISWLIISSAYLSGTVLEGSY